MNLASAPKSFDAGCDVATPAGPVLQRVDEIRRAQSFTHDTITQLAARLEPLLAPESNKAGPHEVRENLSPMHGQLGDVLDHAEGLNNRLRGLLARLTV